MYAVKLTFIYFTIFYFNCKYLYLSMLLHINKISINILQCFHKILMLFIILRNIYIYFTAFNCSAILLIKLISPSIIIILFLEIQFVILLPIVLLHVLVHRPAASIRMIIFTKPSINFII